MTTNSALAQAARRIRSANERLPQDCRVEIGPDWQALLETVKGRPEHRAKILIDEWTSATESRIARRLLHAPIEGRR